MKRSLLSLAVQAACTGQHPADARDTDAGWWQHQGPPAMTGVRFQPSPPPLHESYVTIVHSEPNWIEQLRAPADLEPGDTPLYRGEIGTLDCGYTFKPSRPPVLIGVDMGSGRDVGVTGRWVDGKLHVTEHVRTGPGTPFFDMEGARKAIDDLCGVRERQIGDAYLRRAHEHQRNRDMAKRLASMGMGTVATRTWFDGEDVRIEPVPMLEFTPEVWGDRASLHGLEVEVGPMLFEMPTMGAEWSGVPGDPFINLERVRRTPHGGEPWDHATGEAS